MKKQDKNSAIFRVHKTKNYTTMSNHHLNNKELSLKAKGLLCVILSLPDDWNYSINGLASLSSDGRDSILSAIKNLKDFGYLSLEKERDSKGHFTTIYNVYEIPKAQKGYEKDILSESDLPNRENRYGKTDTENPIQLNTNNKILKQNTKNKDIKEKEKKEKEKISNETKKTFGEFENVFLTEKEEDKLRELYKPNNKFGAAVEILSSYKAASGKKYKSDYAVLNKSNWVFSKVYQNTSKENPQIDNSPCQNYESVSRW